MVKLVFGRIKRHLHRDERLLLFANLIKVSGDDRWVDRSRVSALTGEGLPVEAFGIPRTLDSRREVNFNRL